MIDANRNWAGNYKYKAVRLHRPETVEQVQELVTRSSALKVLGARHSFNGIADSSEVLISFERLKAPISLDRERRTVTVPAGIRYGDLSKILHKEGYALRNLASLPHISVAGACATATHGSGDGNGNLATAVRALEFVSGNGEIVALSRDSQDEGFEGAVVGLGAFGVVTKLTLEVVPTFAMTQVVYEHLPFAQAEVYFDAIFASAYSVSLFTDWRDRVFNQVWLKRRTADPTSYALERIGAVPAREPRHPVPDHEAGSCTEQLGIPGPWYERLPHFRADFSPSSGDELQSEYFVPRPYAWQALRAIEQLRERIAPLLWISEVRTIAADRLWMSPCYEQASVAIHFTWKNDWRAVRELLPAIEAKLAPFGARPHWGKLFAMSAAKLEPLYDRLPDFRKLVAYYDPRGKFRNDFVNTYVFGCGSVLRD